MKQKRIISIIIIFVIIIGVSAKLEFTKNIVMAESQQQSNTKQISLKIRIKDYLSQPNTNWGVYKEKVEVKGIFVTGRTFDYGKRIFELIDLVNNTELNAMVIDVKNDKGILSYKSNVNIAKEIGANDVVLSTKFSETMEILLQNNIYPIARIVTFKDRIVGSKRPDLVIKHKNGQVWRDNKGNTWLNPFNKESWEYPIQLAEEAALMGFKEIQFDYVRFPTDGNRNNIDYGDIGKKTKAEAIAEFLSYARERIEPLGAHVSADIFGDIINVKGDSGIGQHLETLSVNTDVLCPMVYPSHYALGSYGVAYPDSNPYKIIYEALSRAVNRINNVDSTEGEKAIIRPWLQDFSATWLKRDYGPHYTPYGSEQVRAQIQATYDTGLKEWILWNSSNRYTEEAFIREEDLQENIEEQSIDHDQSNDEDKANNEEMKNNIEQDESNS